MGDPVAYGIPSQIGAFFRRNDVVATGMAVTFAAIAAEVAMPGGNAAMAAAVQVFGDSALRAIGSRLFERYFFLSTFFPNSTIASKCINTDPDQVSPKTVAKWGFAARILKRTYTLETAGLMFTTGTDIIVASMNGTPRLDTLVDQADQIVSLTRGFSGWHRWNKVANGEWTIDDRGPPPERAKENMPLNANPIGMAARVAHGPT